MSVDKSGIDQKVIITNNKLQEDFTQDDFETMATIILNPLKSYYTTFSEFTPLDFEHFCVYLLQVLDYQILSYNNSIKADGGIDFVAEKEEMIIIGQCKKTDWIMGEKEDRLKHLNISIKSVKEHFATVILNEPKYPNKNLVGYFITLRKFTAPSRMEFDSQSKIKLIDFFELQKLIKKALRKLDSKNTSLIINQNADINPWYDAGLEKIRAEIKILEKLIADLTIELEIENSRVYQAQKIVMENLTDLYRHIDLLTSRIRYLKYTLTQKEPLPDIEKLYENEQGKINEDYDDLEQEYSTKVKKLPNQEQTDEIKELYRKLSHLYHPDKNIENKDKYNTIFSTINNSKTNLQALKDIEQNPFKYFDGDIPDALQLDKQKLADYLILLQQELVQVQAKYEETKENEYSILFELYHNNKHEFDNVVDKKRINLEEKAAELLQESQKLEENE